MFLTIVYLGEEYQISYDFSDKWIDIKNRIIIFLNNKTNTKLEYIDLEYINTIPVREFGKQSILPGLFEQINDDLRVDSFISKTKNLIFKIHPATCYLQKNTPILVKEKTNKFSYKLEDFPTL